MSKKSEARRAKMKERQKERIKNKDNQSGGRGVLNFSEYDDISFFKPEKGNTYQIDVLPFIIETDKHPQGFEPGDQDYVLDYWAHFGVGPQSKSFLCLNKTYGKRCPICEIVDQLWKEKDPDKDEIQSIKAKRRVLYNVIDLNSEDKGTQLFSVSHWLFEKELLDEAENSEIDTFADLEEGKTISFRAVKGAFKDTVAFKKFDFEDRDEEYDEEIFDSVYPLDALLVVPTFDEVENAHLGIEDDEVENEDEATETKEEVETEVPDDQEVEENEDKTEEVDFDKMKPKDLKQYIEDNGLDIKGYKKMKPKVLRQAVKDFMEEHEQTEKDEVAGEDSCPYDLEFAVDFEEKKACEECNAWEKCAEANEKL